MTIDFSDRESLDTQSLSFVYLDYTYYIKILEDVYLDYTYYINILEDAYGC